MKTNTICPTEDENEGHHNSDWKASHQHGEEKSNGTELTVPSMEGHPVDENESSTAKNTNKQPENVTQKRGDIFDDLEAIGRPLDEVIPSEKVLTSLPVRKPKKDEWVRLHSEIHTPVYLYEARDENSWYLVMPEVVEPMKDVVRYVQVSLAMNYAGTCFVWPVPVPTERKAHRAHITAFAAAEKARREWIRIAWGDGEYDVYRRQSAKGDPVWPTEVMSASEMLRLAAKTGAFEVIDSIDHPVVQALQGRD